MEYTIKSNALSVTVDNVGAQLTSVKLCGKERLWQNDNGSWADHAPVLFPVCGKCAMVVDGKDYNVTKHGVVRHAQFELANLSANEVTLITHSNEQTLQQYPYQFDFAVTYKVKGAKLFIFYTITNLNDVEMPYSCGTHVSFNLPEKVSNYEIVFPHANDITLYCHNNDGILDGNTIPCGIRNNLGLDDEYLDNNNCIILKYVKDGVVTLRNRNTKRKIAKVTFVDYPHMLLWHSLGSQMVCIEPWHNLPDNVDDKREFKSKEGVATLLSKQSATIKQTIKYFEE